MNKHPWNLDDLPTREERGPTLAEKVDALLAAAKMALDNIGSVTDGRADQEVRAALKAAISRMEGHRR